VKRGTSRGHLLPSQPIAEAAEVLLDEAGFKDEVAANWARLKGHPAAELVGVQGLSKRQNDLWRHALRLRGITGNGSGEVWR
jgi:hypothetical protein